MQVAGAFIPASCLDNDAVLTLAPLPLPVQPLPRPLQRLADAGRLYKWGRRVRRARRARTGGREGWWAWPAAPPRRGGRAPLAAARRGALPLAEGSIQARRLVDAAAASPKFASKLLLLERRARRRGPSPPTVPFPRVPPFCLWLDEARANVT